MTATPRYHVTAQRIVGGNADYANSQAFYRKAAALVYMRSMAWRYDCDTFVLYDSQTGIYSRYTWNNRKHGLQYGGVQ